MFKAFKLAAIITGVVVFASAAAHATEVPAGTLAISDYHYSAAVDTTAGTVVMGGYFSYDNGTGQFINSEDPPFGRFASTTLQFSLTPGVTINYDGVGSDPASVANFVTFYDTDGQGNVIETYVFNLDQNIETVSDTTTGQGTTIDLYILGDMTATGNEGNFSTLSPTALTLQLNTTGGSTWSYAATLANPPPGSYEAVPEPASMLLMGGGLAALGLARRRKKV
jgi:hypothetical protein